MFDYLGLPGNGLPLTNVSSFPLSNCHKLWSPYLLWFQVVFFVQFMSSWFLAFQKNRAAHVTPCHQSASRGTPLDPLPTWNHPPLRAAESSLFAARRSSPGRAPGYVLVVDMCHGRVRKTWWHGIWNMGDGHLNIIRDSSWHGIYKWVMANPPGHYEWVSSFWVYINPSSLKFSPYSWGKKSSPFDWKINKRFDRGMWEAKLQQQNVVDHGGPIHFGGPT